MALKMHLKTFFFSFWKTSESWNPAVAWIGPPTHVIKYFFVDSNILSNLGIHCFRFILCSSSFLAQFLVIFFFLHSRHFHTSFGVHAISFPKPLLVSYNLRFGSLIHPTVGLLKFYLIIIFKNKYFVSLFFWMWTNQSIHPFDITTQ